MERLGTYTIEEVLDFIDDEKKGERRYKSTSRRQKRYDGYLVKMNSQRYRVFKQSLKCAYCGIEGKFFCLERNDKDPTIPPDSAHFNLYAINHEGEWVLMTKDHIRPKSLGGRNHMSNYVTCCQPCNNEKSNSMEYCE